MNVEICFEYINWDSRKDFLLFRAFFSRNQIKLSASTFNDCGDPSSVHCVRLSSGFKQQTSALFGEKLPKIGGGSADEIRGKRSLDFSLLDHRQQWPANGEF